MIAMLMFIGHIGILSFLFLILGIEIKETYHSPKERVTDRINQGTAKHLGFYM
ncbi:hypothetical protein B4119_0448 [Parageobacillus caldoxylosilyticus]|jgi:hypothetical protein|uniref:Uncharacterized protein n=1 Tax=Saccharococcus caldoxylosilyticus TaxID=81408 RepID=A0A150KTZ1_9BACL|nr:hypothetical protein B4119_0448 [Parageobacillus caldoxylosilyticus]MBB3852072.1 hypothetical protein [Parageobacillus caldoxylosilyticus]QXJ38035.1 hypothetical protein BV455_01323 [Parageobacillus caldoxylosilyticus]